MEKQLEEIGVSFCLIAIVFILVWAGQMIEKDYPSSYPYALIGFLISISIVAISSLIKLIYKKGMKDASKTEVEE